MSMSNSSFTSSCSAAFASSESSESSESFESSTSSAPRTSSRFDEHDVNPLSGKRLDVPTRPLRRARPICHECHRRPALARIRGRWVVLPDHDVCRQCWRTWIDARAALRRASMSRPARRRAA